MPSGTVLRAAGCMIVVGSSACGAQDIVVARDRLPDAAGGRPCATASDCNPEELCELASCGDTQGQCVLRPAICGSTEQVVCGCDGVTYWNDCLRQRDGVASSSPGQCSVQYASCTGAGSAGCPVADAVCGRLLPAGPGSCPPAGPGACWVLPDSCPADAGGPFWQPCGPTPGACVDLCTALRAQAYATRAAGTACP